MRTVGSLMMVGAVLLLSPASLSSQLNLGLKAGWSLATLGGSDFEDVDPKYRNGFGLGASLEVPLTDILSFQPEVFYLQKGAKATEEGVDITVSLDYVEIPALLRINVPVEGNLAPYFLVGPAIGIESGCELTGEGQGIEVTFDCKEAGLEVKSVDFGGIAGAGLSFGVGPGRASLGARYNLGLTSLDDSGAEEDVKNRAFSFLVGFSLPLGG